MFRFFRTAILGIILMCGSCVSPANEAPPGIKASRRSIISEIERSTAALVKEDGGEEVPYCAGVWIDATHVLTALHCVVSEPNLMVLIKSKSMLENATSPTSGTVVKGDMRVDLALIEVNQHVPSHGVANINITKPVKGDRVHIIGHTAGYSWTYSEGSVSAVRDHTRGLGGETLSAVQVSGFIWMGNSGGGAWNSNGELIGISSWIYAKAPGIAFFISSKEIKQFLQEKQ